MVAVDVVQRRGLDQPVRPLDDRQRKNLQAMEFLRKLANTDKVTEPNPGSTNRTDGCWSQFAQGKVAMTEIMPLGTSESTSMKGSPCSGRRPRGLGPARASRSSRSGCRTC